MMQRKPMKRTGFKPRQQTLSQRAALKKARKPNPLKPDTRSAVSKKPWRSPEYRAFVRDQKCLGCAHPGMEAHHIRELFPRTMGVRISDAWVVPLCEVCHCMLHARGGLRFWEGAQMTPHAVMEWCALSLKKWERTNGAAVNSEKGQGTPMTSPEGERREG